MKTFLYTFGLLTLALLFGGDVLAQNAIVVEPLTSIGEEAGNQAGIGPFINMLYRYGVGIGAILAVLLVMYGGFQYMTSEAVGSKSEARDAITRAILGLLLLLSPVIVFGVINRDILDLNIDLTRLGDYERLEVTNDGGREALAASCSTFEWRRDSLLGSQQNIIAPAELRSAHLPREEEMSTTQLSTCCSFAEGWIRTNNRQIRGTAREYTEISCEYRDVELAVKATVHFSDGTRIPGTAFNLFGDVKIGLCKEVDERDSTAWADSKINELYQNDTLNFDAVTLGRIGDESLIDRLEIAGGSSSVACR